MTSQHVWFLACGWILLLAAFAVSFVAQNGVANELAAMAGGDAQALKRGVSSGVAGALPVWLIVVRPGARWPRRARLAPPSYIGPAIRMFIMRPM